MLADLLMPLPIVAVIFGFIALAGLAAQSLGDLIYRHDRRRAASYSRVLDSARF